MADDQHEGYQSLYRRYRPQRFDEVRGQDHVTTALRNAVRSGRVGHAYLFSGPRGTGKTSTARILAMALNCEHPVDGEPDGTCDSCVEVRRGASLDVAELDAASNRGVDEMRDLLSRVSLGVRARWRVYILDEVHQLTPAASATLLKTLEEPPAHVIFVLATTDPQRVLPTIRSRTQHFEFKLLSADTLGGLLDDVNRRAGLGVAPEALDLVVRRGHGSARDALSVLDQVAAAGAAEEEVLAVADVVDAIADHDPARLLAAVAEGVGAGWEPRRLAGDVLERLRNGFLATQARALVPLPDDAVAEVEAQVRRLGPAATVRAMEVVGEAVAQMRDSVDPRITLEVALLRVTSPSLDSDVRALLARVERLEAALAGGAPPAPPTPGASPPPAARPAVCAGEPPAARPAEEGARRGPPAAAPPAQAAEPPGRPPAPPGPEPGAPPRSAPPMPGRAPRPASPPAARAPLPPPPELPRPGGAAAGPRPTLGSLRRGAGTPQGQPQAQPQGQPPEPRQAAGPRRPVDQRQPAAPGRPAPTRDELVKAWGDVILPNLPGNVRAYLAAGRFVDGPGPGATVALPDAGLLRRAEGVKGAVEEAIAAHFGTPVRLTLVLDATAAPVDEPMGSPDDYDFDELADAGPAVVSAEQRLLEAFPGAEEVT